MKIDSIGYNLSLKEEEDDVENAGVVNCVSSS
jgi:hypothetical protein